MINTNTRVHLIKKLDATDLSGEKAMIDFSTGKYFLLKGAANEIWDFMVANTDTTVEAIKNELLQIYEVDEETCLTSICEFLENLKINEFVRLD